MQQTTPHSTTTIPMQITATKTSPPKKDSPGPPRITNSPGNSIASTSTDPSPSLSTTETGASIRYQSSMPGIQTQSPNSSWSPPSLRNPPLLNPARASPEPLLNPEAVSLASEALGVASVTARYSPTTRSSSLKWSRAGGSKIAPKGLTFITADAMYRPEGTSFAIRYETGTREIVTFSGTSRPLMVVFGAMRTPLPAYFPERNTSPPRGVRKKDTPSSVPAGTHPSDICAVAMIEDTSDEITTQ
mmetsp:Transcript_17454/g.41236  ORF Transcript_17454/g.41236 Transcript_17454/m.41236 type:complete len:245 (-) Transcript_17454:164-898(-)